MLSSLAAGLVVYGDAPSPIRPAVVLWFVAVCPGMAVVGLLSFREPIVRFTLAVTLSLSLSALLAALSLYAGLWSPSGVLAWLIGITMVGAVAQTAAAARCRRRLSRKTVRRRLLHPLVSPRPAVDSEDHLATIETETPALSTARFALPLTNPVDPERPSRPTDLSDAEWQQIAAFVPFRRAKDRYDPREICNAVLFVIETDADWRALPNDFPPAPIVRRFHWRLRRSGSWGAIEASLGRDYRRRRGDAPTRRRRALPTRMSDVADREEPRRSRPRGDG